MICIDYLGFSNKKDTTITRKKEKNERKKEEGEVGVTDKGEDTTAGSENIPYHRIHILLENIPC